MNALAKPYDVEAIRKDFAILGREVYGKPLVYLDNAASAQKPEVVIEAMTRLMREDYSNVHRGLHYLANASTEAYEAARESARRFLNAAASRGDHFHALLDGIAEYRRILARPPSQDPGG
jgi:cysteine desulfurase/selenocysteine lyase